MNILIITNYQNDFVEGELGFEDAKKIEPVLYEKVKMYLENNDKVVFIKSLYDNYGTYGYNTYGRLYEIEKENIDSGNVAVFSTNTPACFHLLNFLSNFSIEELEKIEVCGVTTDVNVLSNAVLCKMMAFNSEIVVDANACASNSLDLNKAALSIMENMQIKIINKVND